MQWAAAAKGTHLLVELHDAQRREDPGACRWEDLAVSHAHILLHVSRVQISFTPQSIVGHLQHTHTHTHTHTPHSADVISHTQARLHRPE